MTITYVNNEVRRYLIELSRQRINQTVTYQQLSDECNLELDMRENPYDRKIIGKILGDISAFEHENDRPLLSSLVLRAGDNYEGDGFYKLAEELGFGNWKNLKREGVFEIEQMKKCIEFWTNDSNYHKYKEV